MSDIETIPVWNPTLLQVYDECPLKAYFKGVKKIPEPRLETLEELPNERGSRIHDEAENFVRGKGELTHAIKKFDEDFEVLRELFVEGKVTLEELWAVNEDWEAVGGKEWGKHWGRLKIDVYVQMSDTHAIVIDYKTGKKYGNEVKHGDQVLQYAICALLRFHDLEKVTVELWYLDQNTTTSKTFTREQAMRFFPPLQHRITFMMMDTMFRPRPNSWNCRFCPYKTGMIGKKGPEGTGHCDLNPN